MKKLKGLFGGGGSKEAAGKVAEKRTDSTSSDLSSKNVAVSQLQAPASSSTSSMVEQQAPAQQVIVPAAEINARLEAAINLAMDYLANEGLETPNIFRTVPQLRAMKEAMAMVMVPPLHASPVCASVTVQEKMCAGHYIHIPHVNPGSPCSPTRLKLQEYLELCVKEWNFSPVSDPTSLLTQG